MSTLIKPLHELLLLMSHSRLLVTEHLVANIDILITMLGDTDRDIICTHYGLFGHERKPLSAQAEKYRLTAETLEQIIEKDLRKIAITPDWQALTMSFSPTLKAKIGL